MEGHMNKNKGFSLIELLVAVTILSIVMIMVTQFMATTSGALNKTRKKLDLQTQALEFKEQFSDIMMQATYIRVEMDSSVSSTVYSLDTGIDSANHNRRKRSEAPVASVSIKPTLVVDGYPNYLSSHRNLDIYMDINAYTLVGRENAFSTSIDPNIQSFRILKGTTGGEPYYVKPKYIYIRYQTSVNSATTPAQRDEKYVIYRYENNSIYMYRGTISNVDAQIGDGFGDAKTAVDTQASSGSETGLLANNVSDFYFSADTETNTVFVDLQLENQKFGKQTYDYRDSIILRNTNVLSVRQDKMFLKEDVNP